MTEKIRVGDIDIAYEDEGAGDPPLVMIHGFTGHRDDFREVRGRLAQSHRVLIPDLRGHGDTSHPRGGRGYDFPTLVDDLEGLLEALGVERCHLLGHSMGGMVTLRFALAHPERLASCIFMNTSPTVPLGLSRDAIVRAGELARERGMDWLQARMEKRAREGHEQEEMYHGEYPTERYWSHNRRRYLAMDPAAYLNLGRAMMEQTPVTDRLGEIRVPSLVLVGRDDAEFLEGADLLEAGLPNGERVTIEGAGHHPHQETPEAWLAAVEGFLERVEGGEG